MSMEVSSGALPPGEVIAQIGAIVEDITLYTWYEGTQGLFERGARFMQEEILLPLQSLKKNTHFCLYSLKGWDFAKTVSKMPLTTPIGESIDAICHVALRTFYASSFFRWCTEIRKESPLYTFLQGELPKKEWLFSLSSTAKEKGLSVEMLFEGRDSLFDCIKEMDCQHAYAAMQYVEGYYLTREAVRRGSRHVVFLLPNDEHKYYQDLPRELDQLLLYDLGDLKERVKVTFSGFLYGESLRDRPYIDKGPSARKLKPSEVRSFLDGPAPV